LSTIDVETEEKYYPSRALEKRLSSNYYKKYVKNLIFITGCQNKSDQ